MKKAILASMMLVSMTTFGQWKFKAGLVAPLPVDLQLQSRVQFKSVLGEISKNLSPKVDFTITGGYLVFNYQVAETFENIVLAPGLRYNAGKTYFGVTAGPSWFSENIDDYETIWSPYVGVKSNNISVDLRYFNWRKVSNNGNTLGLVFSYIL
jgi:hypothetical protein